MTGIELRRTEFTFTTEHLYKYYAEVKMGDKLVLPYEWAEQYCEPRQVMDYVYSLNLQVSKYESELRRLWDMKNHTLTQINQLLNTFNNGK